MSKKEFIKKVAPGIHVYMATYYLADEIQANTDCEVEEYIKENLLAYEKSASGSLRYWFSEKKFRDAVDNLPDDKLKNLLCYFDERDMPLCDVYSESCLHPSDLSETEKKWGELLMEGSIITFEEFLGNHL